MQNQIILSVQFLFVSVDISMGMQIAFQITKIL